MGIFGGLFSKDKKESLDKGLEKSKDSFFSKLGKAVVGKVDIDSNQQYAAQFGVRNIHTVLVFKNGELVDRKVGVSSKNDYAQALDNLI